MLRIVLDEKPHDSRDIGCSSLLGERIFFTFGDTFCKNYNGDFRVVVSHTCASVPDKHDPTTTKYLALDKEGQVASFIPLTEAEKDFDKRHKGRYTLWSFSGIAEDPTNVGTGWCWFEIGQCVNRQDKEPLLVFQGTGVARIQLDNESGNAIAVERENLFDVSTFFTS